MEFSEMVQKWPSKPKTDRAARVRENQRRHRAKTKAYIAELENEVAETHTRLSEALKQNASLALEIEELRGRFRDSPDTGPRHDKEVTVEPSPAPAASLATTPSAGMATSPVAQRSLSPSPTPQDILHTTPQTPQTPPTIRATRLAFFSPPNPCPVPSDPETFQSSPLLRTNPVRDDEPCADDKVADSILVTPLNVPSLEAPDISSLRTLCSRLPLPCPGESTIPCGSAYDIINQQNYRGQDLTTITRLLQPGFRRAILEGEDCHVMSSFVFAVIDSISSA